MKLWVTGESSFISRNFARWCDEHDGKHEIVNRLESDYYAYFRGYSSGYPGYEREMDIFDPTLPVLIDRSGADAIVHHAGLVGTDYCSKRPDNAIRTNIEGTYYVIEAAQKVGIPIIFTSTSVCYRPSQNILYEDSTLEPQTIYGMTKFACEHLLRTWMKKGYVIVVPAMLFGAHDLHSASNKLIMSGLNIINDTVHIALDPEYPKPFMYIDNYLDGLDLVIENLDELDGQRINIAPGIEKTKSFEYIINYVTEEMGLFPTYELHPDKDYLGPHILDNGKITRLGWKENVSLEEGLEKVKEILQDAK